jgi:uncharacterized protein
MKCFVGRYGLRAGWGIIIFTILTALLSTSFRVTALAATGNLNKVILIRNVHDEANNLLIRTSSANASSIMVDDTAINAALGVVGVLIAAWVLSIIEGRRIAAYGIDRLRFNEFVLGALSGMLLLSLLVGVLYARHYLVFDSHRLRGAKAIVYGVLWLIAYFFVGSLEEYLNRSYLQVTLSRGLLFLGHRFFPLHARGIAFGLAAIITSSLFGLRHIANHGESSVGIISVFLIGVAFCYSLWRTGSLWWAIGFHMSWDWAQSFFFGVPNSGILSAGRQFQTHSMGHILLSGGSDGPEGSVLVIPILLLVFVIVRFTTRPGNQFAAFEKA